MGQPRAVAAACAAALVLVTLAVRAQTQNPGASLFSISMGVGLPPVDEGALLDQSHTPQSDSTLKRAAMHQAMDQLVHGEGSGASGMPYARGRVIVKFRDSAS